jgi:ABC-type antimicrobial peptide transport system permease subunit
MDSISILLLAIGTTIIGFIFGFIGRGKFDKYNKE